MKRGDIYRADLDPVIGSEQGGVRPVLIIQNDAGNLHSPTVIVAAITSRKKKAQLPVHVMITAAESGLPAYIDSASVFSFLYGSQSVPRGYGGQRDRHRKSAVFKFCHNAKTPGEHFFSAEFIN